MRDKYFLSTKDLVTIAILSALGGALSTYIGYLGNLINRIIGVPFGAGQFMAGLHVIWIVLAVAITRKKGVGTATGLLKGAVESLMVSTLGISILLVPLVQRLVFHPVLFIVKTTKNRNLISYSIAAGLSAATNVFVFQVLFFSGVPIILIVFLGMLAFGSGMIFGGYVSLQILNSLEQGGLVYGSKKKEKERSKYIKYGSIIITIVFLIAFSVGGVYYFTNVYQIGNYAEIKVQGNVNNEYDFIYKDFKENEELVRAELVGSVTHIPEKNYTGIPLKTIIKESKPKEEADTIRVIGKDGYSVPFNLTKIMDKEDVIMTYNSSEKNFRLVATGYDGSYWVNKVYKIQIE